VSTAALLAWLVALAPYTARARLVPIAESIAQVASSREQAAEMVAVSFYESTFTRGIPFGLSAWKPRYCAPLVEWAATAAAWLERAHRACGRSRIAILSWYHRGYCDPHDRYAQRQARLVRRLLARR
jgi:hypothetical protein